LIGRSPSLAEYTFDGTIGVLRPAPVPRMEIIGPTENTVERQERFPTGSVGEGMAAHVGHAGSAEISDVKQYYPNSFSRTNASSGVRREVNWDGADRIAWGRLRTGAPHSDVHGVAGRLSNGMGEAEKETLPMVIGRSSFFHAHAAPLVLTTTKGTPSD